MNLILLGAPGAGKGTHAEVICAKKKIPSISTGNILREAVKNHTELGEKAQSYMEAGKLVPDEIVVAILKERIAQSDCQNGFILDGFPRTVAQAEALDEMHVPIDKVIDLEVDDQTVTRRLSGRRVCEQCGASYHTTFKPPKKGGVCDTCGGKVGQRKDDLPETVLDRLRVYHEQTEPLKGYYEKKGILKVVQGQEGIEEMSRRILQALED